MDAEMDVVFLPCSHMVTCASCAVSIAACPICRMDIKYVIKPILSWLAVHPLAVALPRKEIKVGLHVTCLTIDEFAKTSKEARCDNYIHILLLFYYRGMRDDQVSDIPSRTWGMAWPINVRKIVSKTVLVSCPPAGWHSISISVTTTTRKLPRPEKRGSQ